MEPNPYQSPSPPSDGPDESNSATRSLAEIRNMLHEILVIQRKSAALTRFLMLILLFLMGICMFTVAGIAVLRIMLPDFR